MRLFFIVTFHRLLTSFLCLSVLLGSVPAYALKTPAPAESSGLEEIRRSLRRPSPAWSRNPQPSAAGLEESAVEQLRQRLAQRSGPLGQVQSGVVPSEKVAVFFRAGKIDERVKKMLDLAGSIPQNDVVIPDIAGMLAEAMYGKPNFDLISMEFQSPDKHPVIAEANSVQALVIRPHATDGRRFPLVVIPTFGLSDPFPPMLALYLAKHEVASVMVTLPLYASRSPPEWEAEKLDTTQRWLKLLTMKPDASAQEQIEKFTGSIEQSLVDVAAAAAWMRRQEWVDPDRVGFAGHSVPGILAHLAFHLDPKSFGVGSFSPVVDMGTLIWKTDRYAPVRWQLENSGVSLELFRRSLQFLDPVRVASGRPLQRGVMDFVEGDDVVPQEELKALWEAEGQPERFNHSPLSMGSAPPHLTGWLAGIHETFPAVVRQLGAGLEEDAAALGEVEAAWQDGRAVPVSIERLDGRGKGVWVLYRGSAGGSVQGFIPMSEIFDDPKHWMSLEAKMAWIRARGQGQETLQAVPSEIERPLMNSPYILFSARVPITAALFQEESVFRASIRIKVQYQRIDQFLSWLLAQKYDPRWNLIEWYYSPAWEDDLAAPQQREIFQWLANHAQDSSVGRPLFNLFQDASRTHAWESVRIFAVEGMARMARTPANENEEEVLQEVQRLWKESSRWRPDHRDEFQRRLLSVAASLKIPSAAEWVAGVLQAHVDNPSIAAWGGVQSVLAEVETAMRQGMELSVFLTEVNRSRAGAQVLYQGANGIWVDGFLPMPQLFLGLRHRPSAEQKFQWLMAREGRMLQAVPLSIDRLRKIPRIVFSVRQRPGAALSDVQSSGLEEGGHRLMVASNSRVLFQDAPFAWVEQIQRLREVVGKLSRVGVSAKLLDGLADMTDLQQGRLAPTEWFPYLQEEGFVLLTQPVGPDKATILQNITFWVQPGIEIPPGWLEVAAQVQVKPLPVTTLKETRAFVRFGGVKRGDFLVLSEQFVPDAELKLWARMLKGRNLFGFRIPKDVDTARLSRSDFKILLAVFQALEDSKHLLTLRPSDVERDDLLVYL